MWVTDRWTECRRPVQFVDSGKVLSRTPKKVFSWKWRAWSKNKNPSSGPPFLLPSVTDGREKTKYRQFFDFCLVGTFLSASNMRPL